MKWRTVRRICIFISGLQGLKGPTHLMMSMIIATHIIQHPAVSSQLRDSTGLSFSFFLGLRMEYSPSEGKSEFKSRSLRKLEGAKQPQLHFSFHTTYHHASGALASHNPFGPSLVPRACSSFKTMDWKSCQNHVNTMKCLRLV